MKASVEWPADLRSSVLIEAFLLVLMVDRISFPADSASMLGAGSLFAAIVGLLLRNPIAAFAAFALDAANLINHLPEVANHLTLLILVDIALLIVLARSSARQRAPVALRYGLILLYVTAGFHKLNGSYTDISVSCARFITDRTLTWFALPPSGELLATVNVWLGVLIEFTIPLLLVVRRTRWLGLLIGLFFHGWLALTPIGGVASFSMFVVALYVLFFDTETLRRIDQWRALLPDGVLQAATGGIRPIVIATVVTVAVTTANVFAPGGPTLAVRFGVFVLICLLLAVFVQGRPWVRQEAVTWRPTPGAVLVSLYIMVAASLPYLGGRTQLAFSMFSNLRTEVAPNHDLNPGVRLLGYQDDLVTILESPHPDFDDISGPDLVVPAYEVGRRLDHLDSEITSLTVRRDEVTQTFRGDEITARFEAPSFIESRLIRMRATEIDGPVSCRH